MIDQDTKTKLIASANDQYRCSILNRCMYGMSVITPGIQALDDDTRSEIYTLILRFNDFNEDNDPYGEHDFGCVEHPKAGKIFWKIDVFDDSTCQYAAEFPEDLTRSYRVLTTMLASEY